MNEAKVIVKRGEAVDEYPLPLPMVPTYREMNLIKKVTGLTIGDIILGAGEDPDADFAVAIFAMKRENPAFDLAEAQELFDLPFGAIEIHFGEPERDTGGSPEAESGPLPDGPAKPANEPTSSSSSTAPSPEESGTR